MSRDPTKREEMVERVFRSMIESDHTSPVAYAHQLVQAEAIVAKIMGEDEAERLRVNSITGGPKRTPVTKKADPVRKPTPEASKLVADLVEWLLTKPGGERLFEYRLMGQDGPIFGWTPDRVDDEGAEHYALRAIDLYIKDRDDRDGPGPRSYYYVGAFTKDSDEPAAVHAVDG
jgi:hypothetical protein